MTALPDFFVRQFIMLLNKRLEKLSGNSLLVPFIVFEFYLTSRKLLQHIKIKTDREAFTVISVSTPLA